MPAIVGSTRFKVDEPSTLAADGDRAGPMKQNIKDMPGYDEVFHKLLEAFSAEEILAAYPPEQRLAGLLPEQRLAGLPPEQQTLALSDEVLRRLPDSYLQTLSPEVQEAIRRRIGRPASAG
jgi:hypothetical protein